MKKFLQTFSSGGPSVGSQGTGRPGDGGRPGSPNRPGGASRAPQLGFTGAGQRILNRIRAAGSSVVRRGQAAIIRGGRALSR